MRPGKLSSTVKAMRIVLTAINSQYIHSNPAIYALARAAEALPQPPELLLREYSLNFPYETALSQLYQLAPQVLAFSMYIWNSGYIERLISDLGQLLPQTMVLVGGPQASPRAEQLLQECPQLHGVIIGEGELIWQQLLARLIKGESRPQIPGLLWREDTSGGGTGQREREEYPDSKTRMIREPGRWPLLPFPYSKEDLAALSAAGKVIYYESSRGCPYSCSFCASANIPLRERPLELVLAELPLLAQTGCQIKFVDRTFNANPERALAITRQVLELYRPGLSWHFEISPYTLPPQLPQLWREAPAGYLRLEAGVQSLHQPSLKAIGRSGNWPRAKLALEHILAAGNCHLHLDLIAGLPLETPASFTAAFNELHALGPDYLQLGFLKILPGSPLAAKTKDFGLLYSSYPPYQILETTTMSGAFLQQLHRADKALNSFYNKGHFIKELQKAAAAWPGGALCLYFHLADLMEQIGPGSLSLPRCRQIMLELLAELG